jgi:hypothetical protein
MISNVNATVAFVLGADDPEMREIERILSELHLPYGYAAIQEDRCHAGNSYDANGVLNHDGVLIEIDSDVVVIECAVSGTVPIKVIDHHRPNDPGYVLLPAEFWRASSLGQLIKLLHELGHVVEVTQDMIVLAAMDHCRQAAIRGECPGVTAEEVTTRRVREIAAPYDFEPAFVHWLLEETRKVLRVQPVIPFGTEQVIDYTGNWLGVGWSIYLLLTQTALDVLGKAALLHHSDKGAGGDKITLSGHVTPEMVDYFMTTFAVQRGLKNVYGVPNRGYAGGYL